MSLTQLHDVPPKNLILLVGPPGSGKSTFCQDTVLNSITLKPVIYVTTEATPAKIAKTFQQRGLDDESPHILGFIDAFQETVGLPSTEQPNAIGASCKELTSLSIAVAKMRARGVHLLVAKGKEIYLCSKDSSSITQNGS